MKTVVIGSKEICLGLGLAGVKEQYYSDAVDNMTELVERLLQREDVGIIIIDDGSYSSLNWALKKKLEVVAKPSVITVPNYGSRTVESESLSNLVKRALGFDLKKK